MTPLEAYIALRRAEDAAERPLRDDILNNCYLGRHGTYEGPRMPACQGRLIRAHLIPKRILRVMGLTDLIWANEVWVWACGGITGCAGHHGQMDASRRLRLSREVLPAATERFAQEHNLGWYLDREYGPKK